MKALSTICVSILTCVLVTACASDQQSEGVDEQSLQQGDGDTPSAPDNAATSAATGDELGATVNACVVTWSRCADPAHDNRPSYCTNGQCGGDPRAEAQQKCLINCPNTNCNINQLFQLPQC